MIAPVSGALEVAGRQADEIGWLWDVFLAVSVVVTAGIVGVLVAAVIRGARHRREHDTSDPLAVDHAQERRMHGVIIGATAVTVVTLIGLLIASVSTGRALAELPSNGALTIEVTGKQWWWQVEYEDPDPWRHVITANEIHVPVGQTVILELRASDVIHSFWVPSIHGKKDLIPGRVNRTWIRVDHPGVYWGRCAEFCGLQHANMAIAIIAHPPEEFAAWREHAHQPSASPSSIETARGKEVFMRGTCAMCHAIAGTPAAAGLGPDLTHVASRMTIGAGTLTNTREHMAAWIRDSQEWKPGNRMPPNVMSDGDLQALLLYLESLR